MINNRPRSGVSAKGWFALCLLAALAPGTGVSAQTFDVSATLNTGLFVQFTDMENAGPYVYGGSAAEADPLHVEIDAQYVNADKSAGIVAGITLKATGITTTNFDQSYGITRVMDIDDVYGWLKPGNGILTVYGGAWESELFETPSALESNLESEGLGIVLVAAPPPPSWVIGGHALNIGIAAFAKEGHTTLFSEGKYIFSASYQIDNLFKVVANFALRQYGPLSYADKESTSYDEQKAKDHRCNFGINYLGLSSFGFSKLAVDFEARDLGGGRRSQRDRFADPLGDVVYPLYFGEQIEWGTGALTMEGTFKQLIRLGDDHPLYAPSFYWMVKGLYKINDFIVPKLGFEYIMNSLAWENEIDMRFDKSLEWEDCEKDKSGLGVLAAVEFRIGGGTLNVIELGYSLKADTSTDAKPDVRTATLDQAVYAAIKISR